MTQTERRLWLIQSLLGENERYKNVEIPRDEKEQFLLYRSLVNVRMPAPVSEEYLAVEDAFLAEENRKKGIVHLSDLTPAEEDIYLWQGDITTLECDAIVNAANSQMLGCFQPLHACIDNAIHSAAGLQLRQECYEQMCIQGHEEPTGKARLTKGYNLPAKYVLHTVGPICTPQGSWLDIIRGIKEDIPTALQRQQLADSYRNCLDKAAEAGCESMAFCCISTGVFGFPNEPAAQIAIQTVKDWLASSKKNMQVIFCVFKDIDKQIYNKIL